MKRFTAGAALLLAAAATTSACAKHDDPNNVAAAAASNDDETPADSGLDNDFSSDGVLSNAVDGSGNASAVTTNGV